MFNELNRNDRRFGMPDSGVAEGDGPSECPVSVISSSCRAGRA